MSLARAAAQLLNEAGIQPDDILREAGVDRAGAIRQLASKLGVNINDLADAPARPEGDVREVNDADVAKVRDALGILNRAFG